MKKNLCATFETVKLTTLDQEETAIRIDFDVIDVYDRFLMCFFETLLKLCSIYMILKLSRLISNTVNPDFCRHDLKNADL